jgi:hypothetical protein
VTLSRLDTGARDHYNEVQLGVSKVSHFSATTLHFTAVDKQFLKSWHLIYTAIVQPQEAIQFHHFPSSQGLPANISPNEKTLPIIYSFPPFLLQRKYAAKFFGRSLSAGIYNPHYCLPLIRHPLFLHILHIQISYLMSLVLLFYRHSVIIAY